MGQQDKNLSAIKARLTVPVIVQDILSGAERLDDTSCYSLHAMIGDMKPHEALLSIAISARTLLSYCDPRQEFTQALKQQCEAMIKTHMQFLNSSRLGEIDVLSHLPAVATDLHSIHVSMKELADRVGDQNPIACILCDIFSVQAQAQKMIAEEFMELYEMLAMQSEFAKRPASPFRQHRA